MLPSDRERDYRKDAWLQRHRIDVLRVGELRFEHDRQGILEDLLGLLGLDGIAWTARLRCRGGSGPPPARSTPPGRRLDG